MPLYTGKPAVLPSNSMDYTAGFGFPCWSWASQGRDQVSAHTRCTTHAGRMNGGCWAFREELASVGVTTWTWGDLKCSALMVAKPSLHCHTLFDLEDQLLPRKGLPAFVFWTYSQSCSCLSCLSAQNARSWSAESMVCCLFRFFSVSHGASDGIMYSVMYVVVEIPGLSL